MHFSTWILFIAVAMVAILSPGPAVFLAISNSVRYGWRRVAFSCLGNVAGLLVISSLAMAGMGAVVKASAAAFTVLKVAGAGYLIYLGLRQWRTQASLFAQPAGAAPGEAHGKGRIFRQGLLVALTNPKAILFFTALYPHFIQSDAPLLPQFAILTGTFMSLSFTTLMCYGALAQTVRTWFAQRRRASWFNRVSGTVFLFLGLCLLRLKAGQV